MPLGRPEGVTTGLVMVVNIDPRVGAAEGVGTDGRAAECTEMDGTAADDFAPCFGGAAELGRGFSVSLGGGKVSTDGHSRLDGAGSSSEGESPWDVGTGFQVM